VLVLYHNPLKKKKLSSSYLGNGLMAARLATLGALGAEGNLRGNGL